MTPFERAAALFRRFSGHNPRQDDVIRVNMSDVVAKVGKLEGVIYSAVRDGKREKYLHEFKGNSQPVLAVSDDGEQIYIVAGRYKFTSRGFVDKR